MRLEIIQVFIKMIIFRISLDFKITFQYFQMLELQELELIYQIRG